MFQSLAQGSTLFILYKNEYRVDEGRVVSVNTHMPTYNPSQPMAILNGPVTDITVQVGNDSIPFAGLPANGIVANFQDKGLFISTDRSAIIREVETIKSTSLQAIEQLPAHKKIVEECDVLLIKLQPEKKKEAEQAQDIENLKTQLSGMSDKVDKLVELLSAKLGI